MNNERSKVVRVREHHLLDIMLQVEQGRPDSLPAYIPRGIREANEYLVRSIVGGAEVIIVRDRLDRICLGCPKVRDCDAKD